MITIKFKKLRDNFKLPQFAKDGDAGADVYICEFKRIDGKQKQLFNINAYGYKLKPSERIACCLGFSTEIPPGYYAQLVPRSGLALWEGLTIVNSPGTIDEGYRNEWIAIALNTSKIVRNLKVGERIAQLIIRKKIECELIETEELSDSERGKKGFGSTGK